MSRFSIALYDDSMWRFKLVEFASVHHISKPYKTKKGCERGIENFCPAFSNLRGGYYECKKIQKVKS